MYDKSDKIKKVRDEYERKISDMQKELRKLQSAQKEHTRQQRELQSQETQLRNLKNELFEMKSAKVWSTKILIEMKMCKGFFSFVDKVDAKNDGRKQSS